MQSTILFFPFLSQVIDKDEDVRLTGLGQISFETLPPVTSRQLTDEPAKRIHGFRRAFLNPGHPRQPSGVSLGLSGVR
jgi:hypothetical protein